MGILDNDTVIVDAILTKLGRQKLANGQPLGITQYAFGDTGVDYTLYNPDHPSGSDSYGSAITDLPMLEAVPDDNVFLRYKLYGEGDRNVQNFAFITVTSGTTVATSARTITVTPLNNRATDLQSWGTYCFPKVGRVYLEMPRTDITEAIRFASAEYASKTGTTFSFASGKRSEVLI